MGEMMVDFVFYILVFLAAMVIGVAGAMAGVGGGVLFTPVMLAFTSFDINAVRAAGLFLAMGTSAQAGSYYLRKGVASLPVVLYGATWMSLGALVGSLLGLYIVEVFGEFGKAVIRLTLGGTVLGVFFVMFLKKVEWPEARPDRLAQMLGLYGRYYEESLKKEVAYGARRTLIATFFLFLVGFIGGMFGLGGGWALVPVYNLVMGLPLKVSVACSSATLAVGDAPAAWTFLRSGVVDVSLTVAAMGGVFIGAQLGSYMAMRAKVRVVRYIVLGVMLLSAISLIQRGLSQLGLI